MPSCERLRLRAMPAGGGTTQTAANRLAGARTQFAELVTAAVSVATILLLAPLMPQATLAAVVIVYSIGLIRPAEFRAILEIRRTEFTWALTVLAGVVLLGTLKGIIVAIVLSLVRWHLKLPTHRSTFWAASSGPMCFARGLRSIRRMRLFRGCCCCDPRGEFSSPTPSI